MRGASRLIPTAAQALRTTTTSNVIRFQQPHAGPSRLPHLNTSNSIRSASGTTISSSLSSSSLDSTSTRAAKGAEEAVTRDQDGVDEIPSNLTFEGFEEEARGQVGRGLGFSGDQLHALPSGPLDPIILPLSSLASPTPTLASPSNLAISLSRDVFAQPLRRDILHRCVVWYLSTLRKGNQSTKNRSTVAYSGRKLRQQKGTGKARVGDASSGIRRGGAPIFALESRDHALQLPRKVRDLGLKIALSSKLSAGLLRVVVDLDEAGWKGTTEARRGLCDEFIDQAGIEKLSRQLGLETASPSPAPVVVEEVETSGTTNAVDAQSNAPTSTSAEVISDTESESGSGSGSGSNPELNLTATETQLQILQKFGQASNLSILFLHSPLKQPEALAEFTRKVRNLPGIDVLSTNDVQVWHLLKYKWLVVEGEAIDALGASEEAFEEEMEFDAVEEMATSDQHQVAI